MNGKNESISEVMKWVDILGVVLKEEQKREKILDLIREINHNDGSHEVDPERKQEMLREMAEGKEFCVFFDKKDFADAKDEKGSNTCPFKPRNFYCSTVNINHPAINKAYINYCVFLHQDFLTPEQRVDFERIVLDALSRIGIDKRQFPNATREELESPQSRVVIDDKGNVLGIEEIDKDGNVSVKPKKENFQNKYRKTIYSKSSKRKYNAAYDVPDECYD